jgi:hypothetical protein
VRASIRHRENFKAVKAWFYACVAIGSLTSAPFVLPLFLSADQSVYGPTGAPGAAVFILLSVVVVTAVLTFIPAFALVSIVRQTSFRRGWADAIVAGVVSFLVVAVVSGGAPSSFVFGLLGGLGGFLYWHFAGRPQPPY